MNEIDSMVHDLYGTILELEQIQEEVLDLQTKYEDEETGNWFMPMLFSNIFGYIEDIKIGILRDLITEINAEVK